MQFPHRGGLDGANAAGYRAEAIQDIWSDLGMGRTLARPPPRVIAPARTVLAPEGLPPASLARFAAATWLAIGTAPQPPRTMDRTHECPGGVFVSFRERRNAHRIARAGFWHFDPAAARPCEDVIAATIETLYAANGQITANNLARLKIAVTFLSEFEPIAPRGLDLDRYGVVAQSRVFPNKRGGALPNTQVFISEIEQYRQARETNAGIVSGEARDLFRHDVAKLVEPGETWLPYGTPANAETAWWRDVALGQRLTARARGLVARELGHGHDEPHGLSNDTLPCAIASVTVRLYEFGLTGYGLVLGDDPDAALRQAVAQAVADARFKRDFDPVRGAIVVSILHHPEPPGAAPIAAVARKLRRGLDAPGATHAGHTTILLPHVLPYNNLSCEEFVRTALRLAGAQAEAGRVEWRTFQCAEWVDTGGQVRAALRLS